MDPLSEINSADKDGESAHLEHWVGGGAVMALLLQPVGAPQPSSGRCQEPEELPWRGPEPWVGLGTFSAPPPGDRARSESKARLVPITPSLFLSVSCRLFFWLLSVGAETPSSVKGQP